MPTAPALTREVCADAAAAQSLAAACIAAPGVESSLSLHVYALEVAVLDRALQHSAHAAAARERAGR